jgi:hypothetical protein
VHSHPLPLNLAPTNSRQLSPMQANLDNTLLLCRRPSDRVVLQAQHAPCQHVWAAHIYGSVVDL